SRRLSSYMSVYAYIVLIVSPLYFFSNETPTTEIYTLSLHDALPISRRDENAVGSCPRLAKRLPFPGLAIDKAAAGAPNRRQEMRSEEHTSELQSHLNLVCRLLLEKKNK